MRRATVLLVLLICIAVGNSYSQTMQCALVEVDTGISPQQPLPGHYYDGQTVTFCYSLQGYAQWGSNWVCGFALNFGPGWDTSTITPISAPGSCDGWGGWGYYTSCHSTGTGLNFGPGFYYDRGTQLGGVGADGIPGNNLGDYTVTGSCVWNLCFSIKVKYAGSGQDLSVSVTAMGDGTCGSWDNQGQYCAGIPSYMINPGTTTNIPNCTTLKDSITSTQTSCAVDNGTVTPTVTGGYPPYNFEWSNKLTSSNIYGLGIGNYCVTVTDVNGCSLSDCASVTEDNNVKITTSSGNVSCFGNCDGFAQVSASGGSGSYSYLWIPQEPSEPNVTGLCAGTYNLTVTDVSSSCKRTATYQVNQYVSLQANTGVSPVKCHGDCNGAITVSAFNGLPPYSYYWSNNATDSVVSNLCAGIYHVTVTDANGCSLNIVQELTEPLAILLNEKLRNTSCFDFKNGSIAISPTQGVPPYSINWGSGATTDSIGQLGTGLYPVTVTDANGCQMTRSYFITQPPILGDTIFSHDAACPDATDGSLEVTVFGGTIPYTYLWNTSPPQITTTVSGLAPGTYKVFVTDSMGCKIVDTATVGALPLFTVTASPDQEMKKYSSVDLSFTISRKGIYQVSWSPQNSLDNPNSDNPVASPSVTTTYVIEVTQEGTGCRAEDSTVVVVLPTDYLFVPNAFSPNGDGINDLFYPLKGELVNITEFKIFDRWGNLVFDDPNGQWNGKSRSGAEMPVAAYAWYVEYTLDGQTYKEKGNVTLIR